MLRQVSFDHNSFSPPSPCAQLIELKRVLVSVVVLLTMARWTRREREGEGAGLAGE